MLTLRFLYHMRLFTNHIRYVPFSYAAVVRFDLPNTDLLLLHRRWTTAHFQQSVVLAVPEDT